MFSLMPWRKERKSSGSLAPRTEDPLSLFPSEVFDLFGRLLSRLPTLPEEGWLAVDGLDLEETDQEVIVHTDAPGFEPADFNIEVKGDTLKIAAEHKTVKGEGKEPTVERRLRRVVTLPAEIAPEAAVKATYHHGVLELHLPKSEPTKTRKIEVMAA